MEQHLEIAEVFCRINDPREMAAFMDEILTASERHDLSLRWQVLKMLHQGVTQREIASRLGASLCKITRGAKILKDEGSMSRKLLDNSKGTQ